MKLWICGLLLLAAGAFGEPLTLINTLPNRPVFNLDVGGVVQTRTLAPGNRVTLEAGLFSGLGEKKVFLAAGGIYYLARFDAFPHVYRLQDDQVLILNHSGLAVAVTLTGKTSASGVLADGALALGAVAPEGLTVDWKQDGNAGSLAVKGGKVYRLILDSTGIGTLVSLTPWD